MLKLKIETLENEQVLVQAEGKTDEIIDVLAQSVANVLHNLSGSIEINAKLFNLALSLNMMEVDE